MGCPAPPAAAAPMLELAAQCLIVAGLSLVAAAGVLDCLHLGR